MAAGMLKGFCPQSILNFLSLFFEVYWVICWEEKIALTAPKTAHVCPTMVLPIQMEQLPSLPFLQGSYLHTGDVLEHEANPSLTMAASVSLYVQVGIFAWIKFDGHLWNIHFNYYN